MFKRILVPLDGSKLAECSLPYVEELARGCGTEEIVLVSATERVQAQARAPEARELYHSREDPMVQRGGIATTVTFGKKEKQAQRYLDRAAKKLKAKGVNVRTQVLCWPPADAISSYAGENDIDLIVMSSHGRSGLSRWSHGSVAERVFRASCVPVMMIKAPGCVPGL
jgi:nucleotide-binding universal stress UspA family protein